MADCPISSPTHSAVIDNFKLLVYLVCLVCLVYLVYLVCLVCPVHLVGEAAHSKNQIDQIDRIDQTDYLKTHSRIHQRSHQLERHRTPWLERGQ
jgi:hypothetical protein